MIRRPLRVPKVRQQDATDCGAACLASIARYHGVRVPIARIRQYAGTDRGGTTLSGLQRAAERLGFAARGVRASVDALERVPLPAVAHVRTKAGWAHYVVLYQVRGGRATVMDPADGRRRTLPVGEFRSTWTGVLMLIAPRDPCARAGTASGPASAVRRLWSLAQPHRGALLEAVLGATAYTVLGLATAIFVQILLDQVLPGEEEGLLVLLGALMLAVVAAQTCLRCGRDLLVLRTGQSIDAALIQGYYRHVLELPMRFFDTMRVGEIVSRLNDAVKIRVFLSEVSLELLVDALIVTASLGLMILYSPDLALLVSASVLLYVLVYGLTNRRNRIEQRRIMEAAADFEGHVVESVGAILTIRRLGLPPIAVRAAERRLVRLLRPLYASGRTALSSGAATELISRTTTVAVLTVGAGMVLKGRLSVGELMSFFSLHAHLAGPVAGLINANRQVQDALIAAERLFDVMDLECDADAGIVTLTAGDFSTFELRGVEFRYGSRPPLFRDLDLTLDCREVTAVVGESGSGKSTLAALLQRLLEPDAGRILLGGIDLRHVRRESLLRCVAVVAQDATLLSGSLLENLAPGDGAPDVRRVVQIAEWIGLDEMIARLPAGLGTVVGERGVDLSGGQRQRVAIARALYRPPHLLILDEATSGLDPRAEALVHRSLRHLNREGMGIVLITHRLAAASRADRILVLQQGRLAEQGTHQALMSARGPYRCLWDRQFPTAEERATSMPHAG